MKTRLYRKWVRYAEKEFPRHRLLKAPGGRYLLALRVWRYPETYPGTGNWVSKLAGEWLFREFGLERKKRRRVS